MSHTRATSGTRAFQVCSVSTPNSYGTRLQRTTSTPTTRPTAFFMLRCTSCYVYVTEPPAKLGTAYRNWPRHTGEATSRAQHRGSAPRPSSVQRNIDALIDLALA